MFVNANLSPWKHASSSKSNGDSRIEVATRDEFGSSEVKFLGVSLKWYKMASFYITLVQNGVVPLNIKNDDKKKFKSKLTIIFVFS